MLALLGWNPGTEQEILSMNQLIDLFSIERVGKSGSKFDPEKAKWFNHHYLSTLSDDKVADLLAKILQDKGVKSSRELIIRVCPLIKERANLIPDLWEQSWFFFTEPKTYDEK